MNGWMGHSRWLLGSQRWINRCDAILVDDWKCWSWWKTKPTTGLLYFIFFASTLYREGHREQGRQPNGFADGLCNRPKHTAATTTIGPAWREWNVRSKALSTGKRWVYWEGLISFYICESIDRYDAYFLNWGEKGAIIVCLLFYLLFQLRFDCCLFFLFLFRLEMWSNGRDVIRLWLIFSCYCISKIE